jgi:SAM-dependent methyltransferase
MTLPPANPQPYLFGDSDLAAARLRLLAKVFEPSTRAFLLQNVAGLATARARIADIGCGPGYTTRLLADVFPHAQVTGIDNSAAFLGAARELPWARTRYDLADATQSLPGGPYDLIYSRYLLTHVQRPEAALRLWSEHLRPGGRIAVEENEWIHTSRPVFARYLEIVEAMLADGGKRLHLGAALSTYSDERLTVELSQLTPIVTSDRDAAAMFAMNVPNWREQPFIRQHYSSAEIEDLLRELQRISAQPGFTASSITFGRRRLVFCLCD